LKEYSDNFYPGTDVLQNKLGIENQKELSEHELFSSTLRSIELQKNPIEGSFDKEHLRKIHEHLFQDTYSWAGEFRDSSMAKGNTEFPHEAIEQRLDSTLARLSADNHLKGLPEHEFTEKLSSYFNQVNDIHPFNDGNGRAQGTFFFELAKQADYDLDYNKVSKEEWNSTFASIQTEGTKPLEDMLSKMIQPQSLSNAQDLPINYSMVDSSEANASMDEMVQQLADNNMSDEDKARLLDSIADKMLDNGYISEGDAKQFSQLEHALNHASPSQSQDQSYDYDYDYDYEDDKGYDY
jgi:cell filamentation protein